MRTAVKAHYDGTVQIVRVRGSYRVFELVANSYIDGGEIVVTIGTGQTIKAGIEQAEEQIALSEICLQAHKRSQP